MYAHRIYWLLKEYANFGYRRIGVAALRNMLGLTTEYQGRFDHFRTRVLDPVQRELAATNLCFTYKLLKQGRIITDIWFEFPKSRAARLETPPIEAWAQSLREEGVAVNRLDTVRAQLIADIYDEGYIAYVLKHARDWTSKIKRVGPFSKRLLRITYWRTTGRRSRTWLPRPAQLSIRLAYVLPYCQGDAAA